MEFPKVLTDAEIVNAVNAYYGSKKRKCVTMAMGSDRAVAQAQHRQDMWGTVDWLKEHGHIIGAGVLAYKLKEAGTERPEGVNDGKPE